MLRKAIRLTSHTVFLHCGVHIPACLCLYASVTNCLSNCHSNPIHVSHRHSTNSALTPCVDHYYESDIMNSITLSALSTLAKRWKTPSNFTDHFTVTDVGHDRTQTLSPWNNTLDCISLIYQPWNDIGHSTNIRWYRGENGERKKTSIAARSRSTTFKDSPMNLWATATPSLVRASPRRPNRKPFHMNNYNIQNTLHSSTVWLTRPYFPMTRQGKRWKVNKVTTADITSFWKYNHYFSESVLETSQALM